MLAWFLAKRSFSFKYYKPNINKSNARLGTITTPHGIINTPAFIFCATKANIKSVPIDILKKTGTQIILSNTYHLMVQPGSKLIQKMGGIQKFTGWNKPMLTDSGGFQIPKPYWFGSEVQLLRKTRFARNKSKTLAKCT